MHRLPAAVLIQRDRPHADKQETLAFAYAVANQLRIITRCHDLQDCIALLLTLQVRAVVVAVDPGGGARQMVERHGGQFHVAREQPRVRRDVSHLAERMHARGVDTTDIAAILQVDTRDVRRSLLRSGIPPRRPEM